jgi:hypothetical protein
MAASARPAPARPITQCDSASIRPSTEAIPRSRNAAANTS